MNYWWVSQNQTYKDEREGNYLWAPKQNEKGQSFFHWKNVGLVERGDFIFSYYGQKIVSVSVARSDAYTSMIPREWEQLHEWLHDGWRVDVEYVDLEVPVALEAFVNQFYEYLPLKYSPITKDGTGAQAYLFALDEAAGDFLISYLVENGNPLLEAPDEIARGHSARNVGGVGGTKETVVQARVGHGHFRDRVREYWGHQCAVTGAETLTLLRASHIVPWSEANPEEKVDVFNGLLLAPNYDAAFDRNLISFRRNGRVVFSKEFDETDAVRLGIESTAKLRRVDQNHLPYLARHRKQLNS